MNPKHPEFLARGRIAEMGRNVTGGFTGHEPESVASWLAAPRAGVS